MQTTPTSFFAKLLRRKPKRNLNLAEVTRSAGGFTVTTHRSRRSIILDTLGSITVNESSSDDVEPKVVYVEASAAFEAIRNQLQTVEATADLKTRVGRAVARANEAAEIGQTDMHRELLDTAAGWVIEQQLAALGYNRWLSQVDVVNVINATDHKQKLVMTSLDRFPRVVPTEVRAKVLRLRPLGLDFSVVFTDPQNQVKNRDPILFAHIPAFPLRLYFIADWIDEYCDLTLEKFLAIGEQTLHTQWQPNVVGPTPTDADLDDLVVRLRDGPPTQQKQKRWWQWPHRDEDN